MRIIVSACIAFVAALPIMSTTVSADETGMASIHEWRLEGRKTCFVGHFHSGTTTGYKRTKKRAIRDAILSWREFTAAEYGTDWAHFKYANSRSSKCDRTPSGWSCYVEGRPCNPRRRRR